MTSPEPPTYTPARPITAEGARIGLITCLTCGAALSLDPGDTIDVRQLHTAWHAREATR